MDHYVPAPNPRQWRRGFFAMCLAVPFSLVQIWASLVMLSTASFDGPAAVAFPLALGGAMVAVLSGWRWAWRLGRDAGKRRRPALIT